MAAADVTLPDGLAPRARWTLETLAAAAGVRVVAADAPALDASGLDLDGAFFHLARLEEQPGAPQDEHGRFPAAASCLEPGAAPVDALVPQVAEAARAAGAEPDPSYPGGARFAVALTHDIDTPWRWSRVGLRGAAARGKAALLDRRLGDAGVEAAGLALAPLHRVRGTDPNWSFARMAAIESRHGARATCFVLAAHRDPHDGASPETYAGRRAGVVGEIARLGGEVALHASYTAGDDPALLREERDELEALTGGRVRGSRFHYLRMRWHDAVPALDELGVAYDSTLGFAERPGSRAGFSYPFRPWDLSAERPARFLELPLVLMDATLAEARYLGLSPAEGQAVGEQVLDRLADAGGCAAILWHNDRFDRVYGRGWGKVYEALVAGVRRRGGFAGTAGELAAFWTERRCAS